jgi:sugar lactone lactonase YvrE
MKLRASIFIAFAAMVLSACGGSGSATPPASRPVAQAVPGPGGASFSIYVTNNGSNTITVYPGGSSGNIAPTKTIGGSSTLLYSPLGVALDATGNIYVANQIAPGLLSGGGVTVYPTGANGNVAPVANITGSNTGMNIPWGLALSGGRIYVANPFNNGDPSYPFNNAITVYTGGSTGNIAPIASVPGLPTAPSTGLSDPRSVALDTTGNIYVANLTPNLVTVYPAGSNGVVTPKQSISGANTGLNAPTGIAVDKAGKIYVTNHAANSVTIYAAGANGNVAPSATISGAATVLNGPVGITLDASGNIYVVNGTTPSVTVFAAGANGNVAPIASIVGPSTGLDSPTFIALH